MELTNYWWLLIWIFGAGALSLLLRVKRPETVMGRTEERWGWVPAILLMLPFFLWAGFRILRKAVFSLGKLPHFAESCFFSGSSFRILRKADF